MSSPPEVDLDFQDYTPTSVQLEPPSSDSLSSKQEQAAVQIRIPDGAGQSRVRGTKSGGLFQSLLQSATNDTASPISDESLRNLISSSNISKHQQKTSPSGFNWGLNYFAQYFEVDTEEVLERIIWSAIPLRRSGVDFENMDDAEMIAPLAGEPDTSMNSEKLATLSTAKQRSCSYIERFIQSRPDFYGPFWISATLVFAVATFSNIVSFKAYKSKLDMLTRPTADQINNGSFASDSLDHVPVQQATPDLDEWHYSIEELNIMTSVIIFYVMILPTILWFLFWFRACSKYYTLTETICAYGYSLSIFVPLSFLLIVQNSLFRYLMLAFATALSGTVLTASFFPIAKSDPYPGGWRLLIAIVPLCHACLAYVIHRIMLR